MKENEKHVTFEVNQGNLFILQMYASMLLLIRYSSLGATFTEMINDSVPHSL